MDLKKIPRNFKLKNFNFNLFMTGWLMMTWLGLVGFYGISTIVGYLIPDALYKYIKYDLLTHFVENIFKRVHALFFFAHI